MTAGLHKFSSNSLSDGERVNNSALVAGRGILFFNNWAGWNEIPLPANEAELGHLDTIA